MERLIRNRMLYGGLLPIAQPHHVERYNTALEAFGLPRTKLTEFAIDAVGYSPEVGVDIGDKHYLDPLRVNPRFIILSPEQGELPVIEPSFSSIADHMRAFYRDNERAVQLLTLKDVVYGEIEDSTYRVDSLKDILSIRHVEFEPRSVGGLLEQAHELRNMLDRFRIAPDAWQDNELLRQMVEHVNACGDIRRNNLIPEHLQFEQGSFWTQHFGGVYVFHDDGGETVAIGAPKNPKYAQDQPNLSRYISLKSPKAVYDYLWETGRLEAPNPAWLRGSGILDFRIGLFVRAAIAEAEPETDILGLDNAWIDNWIHANFDQLSDDGVFAFLADVRKRAFNGARLKLNKTAAALRFLVVRARHDHPERTLVNRLISEYAPFDFLTRFIVNKEAFYEDYRALPESYRDYVVNLVTTTYFPDKPAFRYRMFEDTPLDE